MFSDSEDLPSSLLLACSVFGTPKTSRSMVNSWESLYFLQGHIWITCLYCNELKSVVFEDVGEALEKWHSSIIEVLFFFLVEIVFFNGRRSNVLFVNRFTYIQVVVD
ncbi:unnamed protein product [Brassica oleracea var. botrytis]